jgi:hypothetical protein
MFKKVTGQRSMQLSWRCEFLKMHMNSFERFFNFNHGKTFHTEFEIQRKNLLSMTKGFFTKNQLTSSHKKKDGTPSNNIAKALDKESDKQIKKEVITCKIFEHKWEEAFKKCSEIKAISLLKNTDEAIPFESYFGNKEYQYRYSFNHQIAEDNPLPNIFNREEAYNKTDEIIIESRKESRRILAGVMSTSGGGKTTFLESYPLYFMGGREEERIPIYITFNDKTAFDVVREKKTQLSLNSRILFNFLRHIYEIPSSDKSIMDNSKEPFSEFLKRNKTALGRITPADLLKFIHILTGKKIILLVDEILRATRSKDVTFRPRLITLLGKTLDENRDFIDLVISTLDAAVTNADITDISQRLIKYANLTPMTDMIKYFDQDKKGKKIFENLFNLQLAIYTASPNPRAAVRMIKEILEMSEEERMRLNNDMLKVSDFQMRHLTKLLDQIKKKHNYQEMVKEALEVVFDQQKVNLNEAKKDKVKESKTYDHLFTAGLFMNFTESGKPVLNLRLIETLLVAMKLKDWEWTPAYDFYELVRDEFDLFGVKGKYEEQAMLTNMFEVFQQRLDVILRKYHFYGGFLFPKSKEVSQKQKPLFKYSQIFPKAKCFAEADKEIFLRRSYQINDEYFDSLTHSDKIKNVFDCLTDTDYDNFINNGFIFRNIKNGEAFDWTAFDEGKDICFITFYQDNYKIKLKDGEADLGKIKRSLKACKEQFEIFKRTLIKFDEDKGKKLNYRLIFRTLRTAPTNIEQLKTDNLIFLGKEEVSDRIEGIFDLRYEFFKRRFFEPVQSK